jgi:methylated-DNA-[protein]-cysteine S-methyltransferase
MNYYFFMNSPLGLLKVITTDSALTDIEFADQVDEIRSTHDQEGDVVALVNEENLKVMPLDAAKKVLPLTVSLIMKQFEEELAAYFSGTLREFTVPFVVVTGTAFQKKVWQALQHIPYGETRTYGELAQSLGLSLGASRAVGAACGANPLPILIPCHRVVAAHGWPGGYSGGLWRKERLLQREGVRAYPL